MDRKCGLCFFLLLLCCLPTSIAAPSSMLDGQLTVLLPDPLSTSPDSPQGKAAAERKKRVDSTTAFALGTIQEIHGDLPEALKHYNEAILNDPTFILAKARKGRVLFSLHRVDEAIAVLEETQTSSISNAEICSLLAYCYQSKGNEEKAATYANHAVNAASTDNERSPTYYRNIAENLRRLYLQNGKKTAPEVSKQILPLYEKAASLDHTDVELQTLAAEIATDAEEYGKAMEFFQKAYDRSPSHPGLRQAMAITLILAKEPQKAAQFLEELSAEYPEVREFNALLIGIYAELGESAKVDASFTKLKDGWVATPEIFVKPAEFLLRGKMSHGAQILLTKGTQALPKSTDVLFARALAERECDQTAASLVTFQQIENLSVKEATPLSSYFYYQYGATLEKDKKFTDAEKTLRQALSLDPNNHMALNHLGYMWAELGQNLPEAEKFLQNALSLAPNEPAYLDSLGWIYHQMGRETDAEKNISQALATMKDDPVVNDHMGDIQKKLGNTVKAVEFWNKALVKSDERPRIQQKIDQAASILTSQKQQ